MTDVALRFDEQYQCTAKSKQSGSRCRRAAIPGGSVCWMHGGASPATRAAAQRRLEDIRLNGEIGAMLAELDLPERADSLASLRDALLTARNQRALYQVLVAGLGATSARVVDGESEVVLRSGIVGPDHLGDLRTHPFVTELGVWTDREARIAKLAIDAGLDEREASVDRETVVALDRIWREASASTLAQLRAELEEATGSAVRTAEILAAFEAGLGPNMRAALARLHAEYDDDDPDEPDALGDGSR